MATGIRSDNKVVKSTAVESGVLECSQARNFTEGDAEFETSLKYSIHLRILMDQGCFGGQAMMLVPSQPPEMSYLSND